MLCNFREIWPHAMNNLSLKIHPLGAIYAWNGPFFKLERIDMRKLFFIALASFYAATAFAASDAKSSSAPSSDKDTAAVVKDEQADNAKDKEAVKKATPKAEQSAKEAADKTKAQASKGKTQSESTAK
jgi:hypothetical protein